MMFVDDVVLCNKTRREAEDWWKILEKRGMKVRRKTDYLCTGGGDIQEKDHSFTRMSSCSVCMSFVRLGHYVGHTARPHHLSAT